MPSAVTGLLLAGGLGRRMGGDKGLQDLNGRPLAAHALARLAPQVGALLVNANQHLDRYAALGYPVVADEMPDFPGPLAGLHAGMRAAQTPFVVSVPCDAPFLPLDLVARLHQALAAGNADLAVARAAGRVHRVFCLGRRTLADSLADCLARGERRVGAWQEGLRTVLVDFDDEAAAFENVNTPEDLARFAVR